MARPDPRAPPHSLRLRQPLRWMRCPSGRLKLWRDRMTLSAGQMLTPDIHTSGRAALPLALCVVTSPWACNRWRGAHLEVLQGWRPMAKRFLTLQAGQRTLVSCR